MIFCKHNYQYFESADRLKNSNRIENNSTNMKKIVYTLITHIERGFSYVNIFIKSLNTAPLKHIDYMHF